MNQNEDGWIWAVVARCILYGICSAGVFAIIGCLISVLFVLLLISGVGVYFNENIILFFVYAGWILLLVLTGIAFVGGAIAGFYSPPQEKSRAPRSPFFQCVVRNGVRSFLFGIILGFATALLCIPVLGTSSALLINIFLAFVGQIYGFGRGLRLARRAALALPKPTP